jgi:hypothetical protein
LQSKGLPNPPAALIKAVIINGAQKLPGIEMEAQGFGRVNLQNSAAMLESPPLSTRHISLGTSVSSLTGTIIGEGLKHQGVFSFTFALPQSSYEELKDTEKELKITMVYNDLPGKQIQNNLNLAVIDTTTREIKHGNVSEDQIDVQNNVEQVTWGPCPLVPLTVRITAQKVFLLNDVQDFVLAWSVGLPYVRNKSET